MAEENKTAQPITSDEAPTKSDTPAPTAEEKNEASAEVEAPKDELSAEENTQTDTPQSDNSTVETIEETTEVESKSNSITDPYPEVQPGKVVRVSEEITETNPKGEEKKRIQIYEGMVIQRKHGKGINATITVRKVSGGIGVEKIYPIHAPVVKNIEVVKTYKVRRAKIGFIRKYFKKLKEIKK